MRLPIRKKAVLQRALQNEDVYLTSQAFEQLHQRLEKMKKNLPALREEVARTQAMGDLSENAAYQEAKYALRSTMGKIEQTKQRIRDAIVIEKPLQSDVVQIGSCVTLSIEGKVGVWEIVGSMESDPRRHRLSHRSPVGRAILGARVGEVIEQPEIQGGTMIEVVAIE